MTTDNSDADPARCAVDGAFGIAMLFDVAMARNEAGMGIDIIASIHLGVLTPEQSESFVFNNS